MRRVLLVQPSLQPPGGGNAVAAWILQALQDDHDVGVLSWTPLDVDSINRFYGTSIRPVTSAELVAPTLRRVLDSIPFSLALLKHALLQRSAQRMEPQWDVLFSVNNETNFGRAGIQYVHYPSLRAVRPQNDVRWYHGPAPLLDAYHAMARRLGRVSEAAIRRNLSLANSAWTAEAFRRLHGTLPAIVYPPVPSDFIDVPWGDRLNGFICIGRISPEKNLHQVIDIISRVRKERPDVLLHLVGSSSGDRYSRSVEQRVRQESSWLSLDRDLARGALLDLIPRYRYGIHGMTEEHFGMAPAEMVAAGCIVFVPSGGGQVEIVDEHPKLTYDSVDDAFDTINAVLGSPDEQERLRTYLSTRKAMFSTERFMDAIRGVVRAFP